MPSAAARSPTREAILDAALRCFTEHGFSATTIEQIRGLSGASTGSIYHHFGGKEQIAGTLYVEGLAAYQDGMVEALADAAGAEEGVRAIVGHHLHWVSTNRDLARLLMNRRETEVVLASEGEVRALNRSAFAAVSRWFDGHAAAGAVRPMPFDLLYATVLGPSQEFTRHWLAGTTTTAIARAERALADAAWAAVRAKGGTR